MSTTSKLETMLTREKEQAQAGTHPRQKTEEKRLIAVRATRIKKAEQKRLFNLNMVNAHFEKAKSDAEDVFNEEKGQHQERCMQEVVERQRRQSKVEAPELRAVTRKMRALRGEAAPSKQSKRDPKNSAQAMPLRQGEVEEDFEAMAALAATYAPNLDLEGFDMDVAPGKRMRPVEPVRNARPEAGGKRQRRGDFDFKGKPRGEISGALVTVWYEEEHGGRKMDVPYIGVVNSCDPREGLYVKFEGFHEEMLITNEDDWRWGRHLKKPPEEAKGRR